MLSCIILILARNITLITNSIEILLEIPQKSDWRIISTGGELVRNGLSFSGRLAERVVSEYNVDLAVISCKGFDMQKGITDTRDYNAQIKKAFMLSAKKIYLAVDNTKFDKTSFVRFAEISDIDAVVTDVEPSEEWKNGVGSALTAYAADQTDANWDKVVSAFVDGWATEAAASAE